MAHKFEPMPPDWDELNEACVAWRKMSNHQRRTFLDWIGLRPADGGPILRIRSTGLTMVHTRDIVDAIIDGFENDERPNRVAEQGCDRCSCGCKYWRSDRCLDCGTSVTDHGVVRA